MSPFSFILFIAIQIPCLFGTVPLDKDNHHPIRHLRHAKELIGTVDKTGTTERSLAKNMKKNMFRERMKDDSGTTGEDEELLFVDQFAKKMRIEESESEKESPGKKAPEASEGAPEHNPFQETRFDERFPVHNLCGPWSSGSQASDLEWAEPADKLLRLLNERSSEGKHAYNMFLAPGQVTGHATNVSIALYIESMSSFKAQTMDFEVDMYFAMGWYDRRLAHNCTHPLLITNKPIAERLWTPDLYFLNAKFAYLQEVTTPNFMVIVYPDGLVFKTLRIDVTLSCNMDLQLFPFDRQECPLVIQSFAYIESLLNLSWHVDPPLYPIATNPELKLNDMAITGMRFEHCSSPYRMFRGTGVWSCLRGYIVMKRLVLFHLIQTYIPSAMLVSISWMTFWLDPRASPARISLTITSLLTLTTMSNGARQDLPQVSYIKAMDIWQTFSQALIFLVLLEYSFVSYFITRRPIDCVHQRTTETMSRSGSKWSRRMNRSCGSMYNSEIYKLLLTEPALQHNHSQPTMTMCQRQNSNNNCQPPLRRRCSVDMNAAKLIMGISPKVGPFYDGIEGGVGPRRRFCGQHLQSSSSMMRMAREYSVEAMRMNLGMMEGEGGGGGRGGGEDETEEEEEDEQAGHDGGRRMRMISNGNGGGGGRGRRRHCPQCQWEGEMRGRAIDRYSRALFPTIFFSFCTLYWLYYWCLMSHD